MGSAVLRSPFFFASRTATRVHSSRRPASAAFSEQGIHVTGRPARRTDSADLREAFLYVDGPVAGPRFPKSVSGVRFLIDVPSLCRSAAAKPLIAKQAHTSIELTRVRIPALGPGFLWM